MVAGQGLQRLGAAKARDKGVQGTQQMEKEVAVVDWVVLSLREEKGKKGNVGEGDPDHQFHIQWLKIQHIFFQQKSIIRHVNGRFS